MAKENFVTLSNTSPVAPRLPINKFCRRKRKKTQKGASGFFPGDAGLQVELVVGSFVKVRGLEKPSQARGEEREQDKDGRGPPDPVDSLGLRAASAEFAPREFLVVEFVIRQVEAAGGVGVVAPAGEMVGPAFRAGQRPPRNIGAADGTNFGRWFHRLSNTPLERAFKRRDHQSVCFFQTGKPRPFRAVRWGQKKF